MRSVLAGLSSELASRVYQHPRQRAMVTTGAQLILRLRQCTTPQDYYLFQNDLLSRVLEVQELRTRCRQVIRRLHNGKSVPADAPTLEVDDGMDLRQAWEVEVAVCDRLDRQLRSIADAMVWRKFDYDRAVIVSLSRNQHPGPMVGKAGLATEQAFVQESWERDGNFALLHDLTSCLRIGDVSVFVEDGPHYEVTLHEVKSDSMRTVSTQRRRQRMAEEALRSGGPLPGDSGGQLVHLDISYRTQLKALREAFGLARERGVQSVKAGPGRTVVAIEMGRGSQLWSEQDFHAKTALTHLQGLRRARIPADGHLIYVRSHDLVTRDPVMPPWAVYPLPPEVCARLLTDYAMFMVTLSVDAIIDALEDSGLSGVWLLPRGTEITDNGVSVLNVSNGRRQVELSWGWVQQTLLLELADLPTWASAVASVLNNPDITSAPWPVYTEERAVWI